MLVRFRTARIVTIYYLSGQRLHFVPVQFGLVIMADVDQRRLVVEVVRHLVGGQRSRADLDLAPPAVAVVGVGVLVSGTHRRVLGRRNPHHGAVMIHERQNRFVQLLNVF